MVRILQAILDKDRIATATCSSGARPSCHPLTRFTPCALPFAASDPEPKHARIPAVQGVHSPNLRQVHLYQTIPFRFTRRPLVLPMNVVANFGGGSSQSVPCPSVRRAARWSASKA